MLLQVGDIGLLGFAFFVSVVLSDAALDVIAHAFIA